MNTPKTLTDVLDETSSQLTKDLAAYDASVSKEEIGQVFSVGQGIVWAHGLASVKSEELVVFPSGVLGVVLDILPDRTGIVLLGYDQGLAAGDQVTRTGRILEVPVTDSLLGRIVDPLGKALDNKGAVKATDYLPVQREAPPIMARGPVNRPLQTGIKVIDALIPIGRGQRELILGDRQTGKTAVALDTIINQADKDVICIYCAIGQRSSAVAKLIAHLKEHKALDYSIVMVAEGSDPPGLQYIAPYAATSMAEYFMAQGRDVLVVYDDLTRHAIAYRQISLLLRRPPGREAFPGDIFYIHSRLLERSTRLRDDAGGGSITALPIIETEAQNLSAYIPTNLISITDGQIYLSPELFQKGFFPAVEVGKSVSRVGGKAQLTAYRKVAGDLRLSYSQFQELESFARFGTRLDEATRKTLAHGRCVREVLKQQQFSPMPAFDQVAILMATNLGMLDAIPLDGISAIEKRISDELRKISGLSERLSSAAKDDPVWSELREMLAKIIAEVPSPVVPDSEPALSAEE
ncbi:MAG: alternate F1F0 ATPase, F1 subunit alpha [Proteobacteria bacterium]|nr:alternate F1F0 ATPase, F1 subunit alpha [Pseudomonadota bacterium]MBU1689059.1 alternate F1F0 ATPase, F1 subunit alpha [Pseudomonadota bacterium]